MPDGLWLLRREGWLIVPLLLITHGLATRVLLQHQQEPAMAQSRSQRSELQSPGDRRS
jgi:hypothetical protein